MKKFISVWDLPIRLFHWCLVATVFINFWTASHFYDYYEFSLLGFSISLSSMAVHQYSGVFILALLLFRIFWGFFGSTYALFWDFIRGPNAIFRYLKTGISHTEGHNALGALSVLGFLILLMIQVISGLFLEDNTYLFQNAPLYEWISNSTRGLIKTIHEVNKYLLLLLIALHILTILFYTVIKRATLIRPMITGKRPYHKANSPTPKDATHHRPFLALILFLCLVLALYWSLF